MDFNWRSPVVPRVAMLAATLFLFCFFSFSNEWVYAAFFLIVSLYQIRLLVQYLDRSHENIASFLDSIRFVDLSYLFRTLSDVPIVQLLLHELLTALAR